MRFGRKGRDGADVEDVPEDTVTEEPDAPGGPRDLEDLDPDTLGPHIDLGSLLMPPVPAGTDLRLQVDEQSGQVLAVLLVGEDGMLEVRAFAAARNNDLWTEVRREIAGDTARRGGTADEREGPFGTELYCQLPVQLEDGSAGMQPSRIIGWNGSRWLLRAALLGRPALEPEAAAPWEETIRQIVVRRGRDPLPPGEALPLQLPPDARRMD